MCVCDSMSVLLMCVCVTIFFVFMSVFSMFDCVFSFSPSLSVYFYGSMCVSVFCVFVCLCVCML